MNIFNRLKRWVGVKKVTKLMVDIKHSLTSTNKTMSEKEVAEFIASKRRAESAKTAKKVSKNTGFYK